MIKGIEKSLVIWSFWMPFKRLLETISHISSLWTQSIMGEGEGGPICPGVKCPLHPQPSCMLSFLCNDQKDWEEPGHLKFLNALQEDTEKNFSYLVLMNIVNGGGRGGWDGEGTIYPWVKIVPPSLNPHVCFHFYLMNLMNALQEDTGNNFSYLIPMNIVSRGVVGQSTLRLSVPAPQPLCMLSFLCNDQRDPGHLKFLNALQDNAGKNFFYLVPMNIVNMGSGGGGGDNLPWVKVPPPPPQPSCMLSFLCNDQRDWEEPGHLKFLNAPQEDTANNLAYLVSMNVVNICNRCGLRGRGGHFTPG